MLLEGIIVTDNICSYLYRQLKGREERGERGKTCGGCKEKVISVIEERGDRENEREDIYVSQFHIHRGWERRGRDV